MWDGSSCFEESMGDETGHLEQEVGVVASESVALLGRNGGEDAVEDAVELARS